MTSILFFEALYRPLLRTELSDMSLETSLNVGTDSLKYIFLNIDFTYLSNLAKYLIIYIIFHLVYKGAMKKFARMLCLQHF